MARPDSIETSDNGFYLPAQSFFEANRTVGLTFDDITLATRFSNVLPRDTDLSTQISERLQLEIPVISADMDTVTEAEMAIAMALNGGLGLIHYNMSEKDQQKQVSRVKNHIHGLIQDPITVTPDLSIADVLAFVERKGFGFRTFPVVEKSGKLVGLLSGRVVKERYRDKRVLDAMTPREMTFTILETDITDDPIATADQFFTDNMGIHKLLVVDKDDHLRGLFTLSDVERIIEEARSGVKAARDPKFRLVCGAAVYARRKPDGSLDHDGILGHVGEMVQRGLDAVAVSTAHGFSETVGDTVKLLREAFPELTIIAGNVTSSAGVGFLAEAGADAIKVGQGPGSICTTRIVTGVGIPQMTALFLARQAAEEHNVTIIGDGGIAKSGDMVKALTLADAVICGSLLAGCREAPGKVIEIEGKLYKEYRGMGSLEAMRAGSAARYGHTKTDSRQKIAAEGIEALKEVSGSLDQQLSSLVGGIQSGLGYLGAQDLVSLRERALFIRVSPAGMREAAPHDIIQLKTSTEEKS